MSIAIFRGERDLEEIADNLYRKLTSEQRAMAMKALLKANPALKDIHRVKVGSVIRVPALPGLSPKISRAADRIDNPDLRLAENVSDALKQFNTRHKQRTTQALEDTKRQSVLLASEGFKRAMETSDSLQKLAAEASQVIQARTSTLQQRQKDLDAATDQLVKLLGKSVG
jgi:hypothetical protein